MSGTKPITFDALSVRAMLDGHKKQHRAPMEPQPEAYQEGPLRHRRKHDAPYIDAYNGGPNWCWWTSDDRQGDGWWKCPFGRPGDLLWVKEGWAGHSMYMPAEGHSIYYEADNDRPTWAQYDRDASWRSADDMPQWASRLTLRVESVRVERVQVIDDQNAQYEGFSRPVLADTLMGNWSGSWNVGHPLTGYREDVFREHWDEKYGDHHPWDSNPWTWVMKFQVIKSNVDAVLRGEVTT